MIPIRERRNVAEGPSTERAVHTHIGGQAVLEGVMMRGKKNWAVAVRVPDGSIHVEDHDLKTAVTEHPWLGRPVIRGVWGFYETIVLAMKAFEISASFAGETEEEKLSAKEISFAMLLGFGLAILLFIVLPAVITNFAVGSATEKPFTWNVVDGILRLAAFVAYIMAVSRIKDIQRVFAYHGAEHKTIHAYERGLPLDASVIQRHSTQHVRCGTSFLLMVMVIALLVYSLIPVKSIVATLGVDGRLPALLVAIAVRLVFLPLIAGLAYEVIKWAGRRPDNGFVRLLLWPGMQLQRMTTREPDEAMIEVAVAAMQRVIDREADIERVAAVASCAADGDVGGTEPCAADGDVGGTEPVSAADPADTPPAPDLLESFMPRASARVQLALAGGMWVVAALLLGIRGAMWIAAEPLWIAPGVFALLLGVLKARFLLDPVARRATERIMARGRDRCAGGLFSWQSWLLVFAMIATGHTLRLTAAPRPLLGVLYIVVACSLVFASRIYWNGVVRTGPFRSEKDLVM